MAYNSYINSFATSGDYETYINGSTAKAPNVGYLKDSGVVKYATRLPNDYVVFGTTTGTTDFTSCGIQFKVEQPLGGGENILYVETSGVPQSLTNLYECFRNTEGNKITKIVKWTIDTSNVTSMRYMFSNCSNLTSLDLSSFDTSNVTAIGDMFYYCSKLNKLYISSSFFNSASVIIYNPFSALSAWTDADSIEQFVQAAEIVDGSGRTIDLHNNTLNAMTQAQKDRITGAGWTLQ